MQFSLPHLARNSLVSRVPAELALRLSPLIEPESWDAIVQLRRTARDRGVEGIMLKRRTSAYGVGRPKGDWWKWKIDPFTIDAVLIYAQPGHGRRATAPQSAGGRGG